MTPKGDPLRVELKERVRALLSDLSRSPGVDSAQTGDGQSRSVSGRGEKPAPG